MNIITKIKKFLTPYKWETIWSSEAEGWVIRDGERLRPTTLVCIVQYDRYKDTYRSYMTDGNITKELDLNWLTLKSETLRGVLEKQRNIHLPIKK